MSPIDKIREEYRLHPREESFQTYLDWHMENGFVFSTPDFFIMGREAISWDLEQALAMGLLGGVAHQHKHLVDCWYVHAMAGDVSKAWSILPWPLEYIAFERQEGTTRRLTIVKTERIKRLSHEFSRAQLA